MQTYRLKLSLLLASGSGHVKSFWAGPARIGFNTLNLTGNIKGVRVGYHVFPSKPVRYRPLAN